MCMNGNKQQKKMMIIFIHIVDDDHRRCCSCIEEKTTKTKIEHWFDAHFSLSHSPIKITILFFYLLFCRCRLVFVNVHMGYKFFFKFFVISFTSYDGFEFNLLLLALDKAEKQNEMKPGATIFFFLRQQ